LSGTLISPPTKKRDFMRRYILILIVAISLHFTCPKPVDKRKERKAYVQLGISALYYNRAQIDEIPKTLAADNTDITTQIYIWSH
jgi:hypothetical protein